MSDQITCPVCGFGSSLPDIYGDEDNRNCPVCGAEWYELLRKPDPRLDALFAPDAGTTPLTAHILRHWSREQIVTFARHLLGTDAPPTDQRIATLTAQVVTAAMEYARLEQEAAQHAWSNLEVSAAALRLAHWCDKLRKAQESPHE